MKIDWRSLSIKKSFSAKLSLYTSVYILVLYLSSALIVSYYARRVIKEESFISAKNELNSTIYQIDNQLNMIEVALENSVRYVKKDKRDSAKMVELTYNITEDNPNIYACAIAFNPYFYKETELFAAFANFNEQSQEIESNVIGGADYNYTFMEWYLVPKLMNTKYWTDPYFDHGGSNRIVCTYSIPLYDSNDQFYGVLGGDMSIDWLTERVSQMRAYENSYNFLLGKTGTYMVHKDPSRILNETIFTANQDQEHKDKIYAIGKSMTNGEEGMVDVKISGVDYYVFYAPIPSSGWSLGIAIPQKDMFKGVKRMTMFMIIISIVGIIVIFYFSYKVIKDQTSILSTFSESARRIAEGDFEAELPKLGEREDELKELHDSFQYMQQSIKQYIKELRETTTERERMTGELNVAKQIQLDMVPKVFPPYPDRKDIDIYAILQPAKEVGGDLFDYFIENEILYFVIGDVSGKGVPASLFMVVTLSLFRSVAADHEDPKETVSFLNTSVAQTNESEMFVTLFVGQLNLKTGLLKFCNAGHNPPLILTHDGSAEYMKVNSNIPVGLFDEFSYESEEVQLPRDCNLIFYTDGLTEAENKNSELYSERRLLETVVNSKGLDVKQITELIVSSVEQHVNGALQSDDITILTMNWNNLE